MTYFGNPCLIHAKFILAISAFQVLLIRAVQAYRAIHAGHAKKGLNLPPGEAFYPLCWIDDGDSSAELKAEETYNGPLAMLSILGPFTEAIQTGKSPAKRRAACVAYPFRTNGLSLAVGGLFAPYRVAMFAAYNRTANDFSVRYGPDCNKRPVPFPEPPIGAYLTDQYPVDYSHVALNWVLTQPPLTGTVRVR